ncbi:Alpha-methyl-mannoside-specific lectin [Arachis hypogaea]|uniref:Alpha-methyl-mannoside-specific lectin n=1 Tax=Arachis hypogaea TaxID=3818 RepID=A0A6B9VDY4_ARAHY|nr:Alpha-methyl-mannoside-specific lectin [Arachis hypogaea]
MAISNTNLFLFSVPLLTFTIIFLMQLNKANSSDSLSFSFDNFNQEDGRNLIFQGDSTISPTKNTLHITKVNSQATQLQTPLEDFVLKSPVSEPADGLTFFIAPSNTTVPGLSPGALLGIFDAHSHLNPSLNQIVAVEFDTFSNYWDPSYPHIGIDVNTIQSVKTVQWERREGETVNVLVSYTSRSRKLEVIASYSNGQRFEVSHVVDLRDVLPEWVRVGFSAATGAQYQSHEILSWSFTSSLNYVQMEIK